MSLKNGVGLPTYDVFGNRLSEAVTQSGTTTTTLYSYDANNTLYADLNGSGAITTRYISGVGGPDLWLAQVDATGGNNSDWLLSDYQGTVTNVVSMSNGSYTQLTYDPYGNVTNTSYYLAGGTATTSANAPAVGILGFQGGMTDPYTGYVKFGARDYDPTTQRWLQQDPTGLQAGTNPYEALGDAPTNYTDPSGQWIVSPNQSSAADWVNLLKKDGIQPQAKMFNDGKWWLEVGPNQAPTWPSSSGMTMPN